MNGEIDEPFAVDSLAVDFNPGLGRVDFGAEFPNGLPIDRDTSLRDQFLTGASRADARVRENFL